MRFKVLKRGTSHKRHEYLVDFYEGFNEREFVNGLNYALGSKIEFEDYRIVRKKSKYYLTNDSSKSSAEFTFSKLTDNNLIILAVKRLEMSRLSLNRILENLISGENFIQPKSQLVRNEQLSLFQSD